MPRRSKVFACSGLLLLTLSALVSQAQTEIENCTIAPAGRPSPFVKAAESGDLKTIKRLLASGVNVDELHYQNETALMAAAGQGRNEMAQVLLAAGANVNKQTPLGRTALMLAGRQGHAETIKILLAAGARIDTQNKEGQTALMGAARDGNLESVELLLDAGADFSLRDAEGRTAFYHAAEGGKARTVERFLALGADPNFHPDKYGLTVLMIATRDADTVRTLIEAGAVVDAGTEPLAMTALYMAAQNGWVETVKVLIEAGADVNLKDFDGRSPLNRALIGKHSPVVEVLTKAGAVE